MKKKISIIGGGAAALSLAAFLDSTQFDITIYEQNKSLGRKFLVAGKGGFNLTHSEPIDNFIQRYTPDDFLKNALLYFDNEQLRKWLENIGIPTFIGSSKRVYPVKGIKPIQVLAAIKAVLEKNNITIKYEHQWIGWGDNGELIFNKQANIKTDYTIFALGGASWKVTGSDGNWLTVFNEKGIPIRPFQAANCAYQIKWPSYFIENNEGKPLKNITISCKDKTQKGEAVITQFGLEGNAIYALSPQIQTQLNTSKEATVYLDLKPSLTKAIILQRLQNSKVKITDTLRKTLNLSSLQINLLKSQLNKTEFLDLKSLTTNIKQLSLKIIAAAPLDEAISTTGGVDLGAVNIHYELKNLKKHYCIGEMLDWNVPTGGYLLQACFSMGAYLAHYLNHQK